MLLIVAVMNSLRPTDAIWRRQIPQGFCQRVWIPDARGVISGANMPML